MRKTNLARLLRGRPKGMFVAPFEAGGIGPDGCTAVRMGLEGIVSKRRDRRYDGSRSKNWIKVENRTRPDDAGDGGADVRALGAGVAHHPKKAGSVFSGNTSFALDASSTSTLSIAL